MARARITSVAASGLLAAVTVAPAAVAQTDTVYVNARIYTPSGWAQAMATEGGRIVAIGADADVRRKGRGRAKVVDLGGRTVFPGLIDSHVHPVYAGLGARRCQVPQGATGRQLLDIVAGCARAKKPGEWVLGGQWQAASMGDVPLTKQTLDRIAPDNPVLLTDISGHSRWANSRALAIGGVTRDTPNPPGGIIERDAAGEPTGILREDAWRLVEDHVPPATVEEDAAMIRYGLDTLLGQGVTSFVDALLIRNSMLAYGVLSDRGQLQQRVLGCLTYKQEPALETLLAERARYARPRFRPDCVKVFMDGVPTDSHTAAMIDPYADSSANAPARGLLLVPAAELNPAVTRWDKMGLLVKYHAAGDAAVRAALDSIAAARRANGPGGRPHQVGHSVFIAPDDIARAKRLDATFEFSPYIWYRLPINDDTIAAVGAPRMERSWPMRDALDAGDRVVAGSDWPVVDNGSPWVGIETAVTRRAPGGVGDPLGPKEAVTLRQAIDIFSINAARAMGAGDAVGSLETGKRADFIVLDRDPFAIPVTDIHNVRVTRVFIDGRDVTPAAPPRAP